MSRSFRFTASFLLALLLPAQGWAAACAQICAQVKQAEHAAIMAAMDGEQGSNEMDAHCAGSETGGGKCCQAHIFLVDVAIPAIEGFTGYIPPDAAVGHWVSVIPETPYHPPIAPAA